MEPDTNPTPLRQLITALRSGKYRQGYGRLRNGDRYDVCGVACDVYNAAHYEDSSWDLNEFRVSNDDGHISCSSITLPPAVYKWYGFSSSDPLLDVKIRYKDLRPEIDRQIAAALAGAEKQDEKLRPGLIRKNAAWRDFWDGIKDTDFIGQETLGALNDELQMTFIQISNVLAHLEKK